MRAHLLLIEDEAGLARALDDRLRSEGYRTSWAPDLGSADAALTRSTPDLVLLDLMLPDGDGLFWLKRLRATNAALPVLVLTARDRLEDTVAGLRLGADDYLTKPFRTLELLARIESLLRRTGAEPDSAGQATVVRFGAFRLDLERALLTRAGDVVALSSTEMELLLWLARNRNRVVTREELLTQVWGWAPNSRSRTVDQAIARLRRKIGDDRARPRFLLTVHQRGYRFRA